MSKNYVDELIKIATEELGYLEKASDKDLDSKTKNAGDKNFTKYSRDLKDEVGSPFINGVPWCVMFVDWCVLKVFGKEQAKKLLYVWTMSCGDLKTAFSKQGRYVKEPKAGDFVIFQWKNSKGELKRHIGIVYKIDRTYIYTIEGNTSAGSNTVIENGGGVFKKSYKRSNTKINGYCRPDYPEEVHIASPVLKKGAKGQEVKYLQKNLNQAINAGLDMDGSFGAKTEKAVKDFQKKYKLEVDGSYGPKTAAMMKEVLL